MSYHSLMRVVDNHQKLCWQTSQFGDDLSPYQSSTSISDFQICQLTVKSITKLINDVCLIQIDLVNLINQRPSLGGKSIVEEICFCLVADFDETFEFANGVTVWLTHVRIVQRCTAGHLTLPLSIQKACSDVDSRKSSVLSIKTHFLSYFVLNYFNFERFVILVECGKKKLVDKCHCKFSLP